ncbi:hypothetical protein [Streptomyces malaysiensis]|uniref:Uncharacterized protein n=1 Tax=Streptomyces malaysiensis subsp. samsunensis TaxID=459658 RepID=A0A9X2LTT4_STRMQ|nr:hypothetical protein [Streptomyces samsunensis]MCQ8830270.1 hypothetical protein [Streptomyces samsunensis]
MPASALTVCVSLQRGCPVCTETQCADPAECLYFLTSRPWADCNTCAGSGWGSEATPVHDPMSIFCLDCSGSGLMEHNPRSIFPDEISDNARTRLTGYVDHLMVRLADTTPAPAPLVVAA